MIDKVPFSLTDKPSSPVAVRSAFRNAVLPWVICGLAAAFYCYEYLLRIAPGQMEDQLRSTFTFGGEPLNASIFNYLIGFYYYAYTPMQLPVGLLMDRYGPRFILTVAVVCCAVGTLIFGKTDGFWVAAFGRFWIGFGSAFAFVGVLKLASNWLPSNRFGMISGLTTTLGTLGGMLGAIMLTDLTQKIGWRETTIYTSYIGFILIPIIWFVVRDSPPVPAVPDEKAPVINCSNFKQLLKEIRYSMVNRQIWINGIVGGLLMVPTMVFAELWGKPYFEAVHHLEPSVAASVSSLIFLGWAVGGPLAGWISDIMARRKWPLMLGAFVVTILLSIFLLYPNLSLFQIKLLMFLIGVFSSVEVICFAVGRENCPPSLAGTVVAVTNFLVVCFVFFQIVVAKILDFNWDGTLFNKVRIYTADNYQEAMIILPLCTAAAFILSFLLKETYCRPLAHTPRVPDVR